MSNIATTIVQSKHLLELGLSPDSADMVWTTANPDLPMLLAYPIEDCNSWNDKVPAWSLSALLEVMKEHCPELLFLEAYWYCRCMQVESEYCDDPITAVYDVLCWLLERGFIKKGGQQ